MADVEKHWTPVLDLQRSYLDRRVWVPRPRGGGDEVHFLWAGGLRLAKCYGEERFEREGAELRWVREDSDTWTLETTEPPD